LPLTEGRFAALLQRKEAQRTPDYYKTKAPVGRFFAGLMAKYLGRKFGSVPTLKTPTSPAICLPAPGYQGLAFQKAVFQK
jgi:hypothetical protein